MPNTPNRGNQQQPGSSEQQKRQRLNDKSLEEADDDNLEEGRIEAPGTEKDDELTPLRTDQDEETAEDEDLPDDASTQVNSNPGDFTNDREKAKDAGRRGGRR